MRKQKPSILDELKKRAEVRPFTIEDYCFDKQLAFIKDPAKFKTAVCSRRAGKSLSCAADLVNTVINMPGDVAYITLNRRSAKRIIWRAILDINEQYSLGGVPDNTELTIKFPNKNIIYVSGAKDESDIEKLRGLALRKVYIDECQSFRPYIEQLVEDVVEPALTDYDGSLILIGTPGPVPAGYFYKTSTSKGWSHHSWTMADNPWIERKSGKKVEQIIQEICERRGVRPDDPSILREFFGKWVKDSDSLVYKFNFDKNIYEKLPETLEYIIGVDIGYEDSDAISVLGYDKYSEHCFLVSEFVQNKLTISDLVVKIKELKELYKPIKIVMDAGALGKKIQEEIRQRHSLHIEAAEKNRKFEFIELLNDDLRSGRFKAYKGSRFAEDCFLVQWDRSSLNKLKISDTYHSDITDSVLYAWRECRHFFAQQRPNTALIGSAEYMDYLEQEELKSWQNKEDSKAWESQYDNFVNQDFDFDDN
jgi:hypothetical protein